MDVKTIEGILKETDLLSGVVESETLAKVGNFSIHRLIDYLQCPNRVSMYSHFRDNFSSKNIRDALMCLEYRKVEPTIVKSWKERGIFQSQSELNCARKGYPELFVERG